MVATPSLPSVGQLLAIPGRALTAFRTSLERPSVPLSAANIVEYLGGGQRTLSGVTVSEDSALRNMAVWRAVNLISGSIAGFPVRTYRDRQTQGSPKGEQEEITLPLFQGEAYPDLSWFEWFEVTAAHLLLWGNAYSLKIRNEAGDTIVRVLPIEPSRVTVTRGPQSTRNPSGKLFRVGGVGQEPLTPAEVMHIPGFGLDGLCGLSPIGYARQAIGTALAAEDVAAKLFDSGLLNGGLIQAERELTEAEAKAIKQSWREKVAGVVRSYEVAILAQGLRYIPTTIPPKDAQWLEARQFGVEEIARLYGVPADLLMDNSATGNTNVEQRAAAFVKFGLQTWVNRFEHRMSFHLCPAGTAVKLDMDSLLRGDALSRAQVYASGKDTGWLTVNEMRAAEGLPPLTVVETSDDVSLIDRVNACTALIRAGFDPEAALVACDLPQVEHLGLLPVTLQKEEQFDAEADAAIADVEESEDLADAS